MSSPCVNFFYKIFFDCAFCILALLPYLISLATTPYRRGFFCDDESIRYPIKPSTVSANELYVVSLLFLIIVVLSTEYYRLPSGARSTALQQYVLSSYHVLVLFAFGIITTLSLTSVAKYSVGRLRPHFIALCKPNVTCENRAPFEYIENYTCLNEVDDSRMSFFSGHSSWSAFTAFFIAMYLQARIRSTKLILFKSLLQTFVFYAALYVSLTRISDYKHHATDVATGLIFGAFTAYCTVTWAADGFKVTAWGCLATRQNSEDNALLQENNRGSYESVASADRG